MLSLLLAILLQPLPLDIPVVAPKSLILSWMPVTNAQAYKVYWSTNAWKTSEGRLLPKTQTRFTNPITPGRIEFFLITFDGFTDSDASGRIHYAPDRIVAVAYQERTNIAGGAWINTYPTIYLTNVVIPDQKAYRIFITTWTE